MVVLIWKLLRVNTAPNCNEDVHQRGVLLTDGKILMKCKQFGHMDVLLGDAKHLALCHNTWVKSRKWASAANTT